MNKQIKTSLTLALILGAVMTFSVSPALAAEPVTVAELRTQIAQIKAQIEVITLRLNVWLDANAKLGADDQALLPPGIKIAPGIEKRLENGKGLPFGILKKLADKDKDDNRGDPKIMEISVAALSNSTATINWKSNEPVRAEVLYSLEADVMPAVTVKGSTELLTSGQVMLTGLRANTVYYFRVRVIEGDERTQSRIMTFRTHAAIPGDTVVPQITFITSTAVTQTSAKVIWVTNEAATSRLWVSATTPVNTSGPSVNANSDLTYYHELLVSNLAANTNYYYTVASADAAGNTSWSLNHSFNTLAN